MILLYYNILYYFILYDCISLTGCTNKSHFEVIPQYLLGKALTKSYIQLQKIYKKKNIYKEIS